MESNATADDFDRGGPASGQGPDLLILSEAARHALAPGPLCSPEFRHGFALDQGRLRGAVVVSRGAQPGWVRVAVSIAGAEPGGSGAVQLDAEVRRSWLQGAVEAADGRAMPPVAIAAAVGEIAALPGQRAVRMTVAGGTPRTGQPLPEALRRLIEWVSRGEGHEANVMTRSAA